MKRFSRYILVIITVFVHAYGQSQTIKDARHLNKEIQCVKGDSIHTFGVFDSNKKIVTNNNKQYYYFQNFELHHVQGAYQGKLLHGHYALNGRDHQIIAHGEFYKGLKNGKWKSWYPNGKLKETNTWKNGKMSGVFKEFDQSGEIRRKGIYKNKKMHGKLYEYDQDGEAVIVKYKKGVLVSEIKAAQKERKELKKQERLSKKYTLTQVSAEKKKKNGKEEKVDKTKKNKSKEKAEKKKATTETKKNKAEKVKQRPKKEKSVKPKKESVDKAKKKKANKKVKKPKKVKKSKKESPEKKKSGTS